jgi:hypothetical protein
MLSVDPGLKTGWALWDARGRLLDYGEISLWDLHHLDLSDLVVLEVPSLGPRVRREVFWAEGIVRFLAAQKKVPVINQTPGQRAGPKARYPLSDIPSPHVRDAIWHGIAYVERRNLQWEFTSPNSKSSEPAVSTGTTPTESA